VANWRFVSGGAGYFEQGLGPSPLEHAWSLAVEEQFYLVWPFVMIGLLALWRARPQRAAIVLGCAAVVSAVWMATLYDPLAPDRAYLGTDTRAQQLLVGAALAWAARAWPRLGSDRTLRRLRVPVWTAGALLVAAFVAVEGSSTWLFRGGFLVLSVLSALVVLATARPAGGPLAWLGWEPLVAVGRRSYGIYLWHWPVVVLVGAPMGIELSRWPLIGLQLVVIVVLTELSYRLIETPARHARRPRRAIAGWATTAAATGAAAVIVLAPPAGRILSASTFVDPASFAAPGNGGAAGAPDPDEPAPPPDDVAFADALEGDGAARGTSGREVLRAVDAPGAGPAAGGTPAAESPADHDVEAATKVLVFGDSTAVVLRDGYYPDDHPGWAASASARLGCGVVPGQFVDAGSSRPHLGPPPECLRWQRDWTDAAAVFEPDISVLMLGAWDVLDHRIDGVDVRYPSAAWTTAVRSALVEAVGIVGGEGRRVALLRLPCMESTSPDTSARNDPGRVAEFNEVLESVAAETGGVETLPLDEFLCPDGEPLLELDGEQMRFDGVHLTPFGAARFWHWLFDQLE
jgi:lysophospholipase L1-like esterase